MGEGWRGVVIKEGEQEESDGGGKREVRKGYVVRGGGSGEVL